jgi:hypothetical protein
MSTELILGVGLGLFGLNLIGVFIFLRIKFNQWHNLDR